MGIVANMPGLTIPPGQKRILADSTNTAHNGVKSPPSAKKRKLNGNLPNGQFTSSPAGQGSFRSKMGSSQPKSHFETEVLEKMTQDISDLKRSNTERDQQWERPSLDDFNAMHDSLCFQQIEIEEGTLHGGQVTLKLFGVSEVHICLVRWKRH
jgi:DNA polymerase delta subunit 1